jgi:hypothetical protein
MSALQIILLAAAFNFFNVLFTWLARLFFMGLIAKAASSKIDGVKKNLSETVNDLKGKGDKQ